MANMCIFSTTGPTCFDVIYPLYLLVNILFHQYLTFKKNLNYSLFGFDLFDQNQIVIQKVLTVFDIARHHLSVLDEPCGGVFFHLICFVLFDDPITSL